MTLKNNGPNEPCSQTNNAPGELSPQITMTGPADPKEQRSWSGWPFPLKGVASR
jgi:hypothetical protein